MPGNDSPKKLEMEGEEPSLSAPTQPPPGAAQKPVAKLQVPAAHLEEEVEYDMRTMSLPKRSRQYLFLL